MIEIFLWKTHETAIFKYLIKLSIFFFFFDFPKLICGGKCNPINKKKKSLT